MLFAVYVRGERPLKYETTRPVSAVVSSSNKSKNSHQANKKPPSGKLINSSTKSAPNFNSRPSKEAQNGRKTHVLNNSLEEEEDNDEDDDREGHLVQKPGTNGHDLGPWSDSEEDVERLVYDDSAFSKLGVDLKEVEREVRQARAIRVNITKPQCVLDFEQDVRDMVNMERQIRKTTEDLQKRLGICENGMV